MKRLLLILMLALGMSVFAQDSISYGDVVEGSIAEGERAEYTFEAAAGDTVSISLEGDFDTFLYLLDAEGIEIRTDDDGGDGLNSMINGFEIPVDGTYTIQAASLGDGTAGDFTLSLDIIEIEAIEFGQEVVTTNGLYTFQANADDLIVISLRASDGFSTTVNVTTPDGTMLFGDYIDGQNTRIGPYRVLEDGQFLVETQSEDPAQLVVYNIEPTPITFDETLDLTFDDSTNIHVFSLDIDEVTPASIVVDSGSMLDTRMDVIGAFGFTEDSVDDAPGTVDPALDSILLNNLGTYYIIVEAANPNANLSGDATITLSTAELATLSEDPVELSFDYDVNESFFTIDAEAGETVQIVVEVIESEEWSAPTVDLEQNGQVFASFNSNGLTRFAFDVEIPETGAVGVFIRAYSIITLTVELNREGE